jgi:2-polyprenyl-3-methyl-5-hydroxy-6-metoxy-1,4-benzoquinol methylase
MSPPGALPTVPRTELAELGEGLKCIYCGTTRFSAAGYASGISCENCAHVFPFENGLLHFARADSSTLLDEIDFDSVYRTDIDESFAYFEAFKKHVQPVLDGHHSRVVEIGSGTGYLSVPIVAGLSYDRVTFTDVSSKMLQVCRQKVLKRYADGDQQKLRYVVMDGNSFGFDSNSIDLALGHGVLHHILHYREFMTALHGALSDSGIAIFTEPTFRFHVALLFLMTGFLEKFRRLPDPADRTKLTGHLRFLHSAVRLRDEPAFTNKCEDKHMFQRETTLDTFRAIGFEGCRVVPTYGRQRLAFKMSGYLNELKVSQPTRELVLDYLRAQEPLLDEMLVDECFSPADTYVVEKTPKWTPRMSSTWSKGTVPGRPRIDIPVESRGARVGIDEVRPLGNGKFGLSGWVVSKVSIKRICVAGQPETSSFVLEVREDVLKEFRDLMSTPADSLLFSGFDLIGASLPSAAGPLQLVVEFADGQWSQVLSADPPPSQARSSVS